MTYWGDELDFSEFMQVVREGMESGIHVGAQACVRLDGEVVLDIAMGQARVPADGDGGASMTPETLMLWLSAGKPITAAATLMLWERGLLDLEEYVAHYIPEFAGGGKERITVRQLLTHTAGVRGLDTAYPFATWEETLARIYAMKVEREWIPGMKAGYHIHTTWYVLGELINRITGRRHDQWIREEFLVPLGMTNTWMAIDEATYAANGDHMGVLYDTERRDGAPVAPMKNYDTPLAASRSRPSASCRGPMRELARFYEMMRGGGELDGVHVMKAETVAAMTMRQRVGLFDQTFRNTIDWGLGVIINSSHYGPGIPYQFGAAASPETFGHGGSQSSTGFCDPRHRLVVALLFNGCCGEAAHDRRLRTALAALYRDLQFES